MTSNCHNIDNIAINVSLCSNSIIVISDASIRNNITTSIAHIYSHSNPVKKTLYHAISITSTEAKLFAIRCGINQAVQFPKVSHIIVITNSIYTAHQIFDLSIHLYQQQSIAISKDLCLFFNKQPLNTIEFWDCPSNSKWPLHILADKEMKKNSISHHYSHAKHHGILTRSKNVITS